MKYGKGRKWQYLRDEVMDSVEQVCGVRWCEEVSPFHVFKPLLCTVAFVVLREVLPKDSIKGIYLMKILSSADVPVHQADGIKSRGVS